MTRRSGLSPRRAEPLPPVPSFVCPYCAVALDPPPARSRRCPSCRQSIVVRRVDGRTVLLAEAAMPVFEEQRQRTTDEHTWSAARKRWLALAETVHVPADRRARLSAAPLSASVVEASRTLYLEAAERAVRAARREKRWEVVSKVRREQAASLYAEAGGRVPPPDDVAALHREGMLAELRSLAETSRTAELVSAGCCAACRADDGKAFRITAELHTPRLPHAGCPKGICGCYWWISLADPRSLRRRRRRQT